MNWTKNDAEFICGNLLQSLMNSVPDTKWESASAEGDDELIFFTNSHGDRVRVQISRGALQDYRDADDRDIYRKDQQLAQCMRKIDSEWLTEALIRGEHLAP